MRRSFVPLLVLIALGCNPSKAPKVLAPAVEVPKSLLVQPQFDPPSQLRPCCAFGYGLSVKLAQMPVPGIQVENLMDASELGRHTYNGGMVSTRNGPTRGFLSGEQNGITYTCHGGFVDVAHVRDYADWTAYFARHVEAMLGSGGTMRLPDEGGRRYVYVTAAPEALVAEVGARALSVALGRWLAFQVSVWHETATWFGWSSVELFPELASAFSPEDLYSNLLGAEIAGEVLLAERFDDEAAFNRAMDAALERRVASLKPVSPETTQRAFDAVDGAWWDSSLSLPAKNLVLRRSTELGPVVAPWLVPGELQSQALREDVLATCGTDAPEAAPLAIQDTTAGVPFHTIARLDVRVDPSVMSAPFAFPDPDSRWVSQEDFPPLVEGIATAIRGEFGADAGHP